MKQKYETLHTPVYKQNCTYSYTV